MSVTVIVVVLLVATALLFLLDRYLEKTGFYNNFGPTEPESVRFKVVTTGISRKGNNLLWKYELVGLTSNSDPKKYTLRVEPKVPAGQLNSGDVIGRASITNIEDGETSYLTNFNIQGNNAIEAGQFYSIDNGGNELLPNILRVMEDFPFDIEINEFGTRGEPDFRIAYNLTPPDQYDLTFIESVPANTQYEGRDIICKFVVTDGSGVGNQGTHTFTLPSSDYFWGDITYNSARRVPPGHIDDPR